MENDQVNISIEHDGNYYKGWAIPAKTERPDDLPSSFHVILNDVFFGNVSFNGTNWIVDQQRPHELTNVVGEWLQSWYEL